MKIAGQRPRWALVGRQERWRARPVGRVAGLGWRGGGCGNLVLRRR